MMKSDLKLGSTEFFRIWAYRIGHRHLFIRSEKIFGSDGERMWLNFGGVEHINLPTEFKCDAVMFAPRQIGSSGILESRDGKELTAYQFWCDGKIVGSVIAVSVEVNLVPGKGHLLPDIFRSENDSINHF